MLSACLICKVTVGDSLLRRWPPCSRRFDALLRSLNGATHNEVVSRCPELPSRYLSCLSLGLPEAGSCAAPRQPLSSLRPRPRGTPGFLEPTRPPGGYSRPTARHALPLRFVAARATGGRDYLWPYAGRMFGCAHEPVLVRLSVVCTTGNLSVYLRPE